MQTTSTISSIKTLDTTISSISLERFTPISNKSAINGLKTFFEVISRIVIYLGFFSFFIGCQTSCTHFMHNLQKIWIHIYVASLTIPSVLKYTLIGFR
jgi:hypothetical protein